jgi:hypothetical protein
MNWKFTILKCFFFLSLAISNKANAHHSLPTSVTIDFSMAVSQYFINPPFISGVINDPTDPAATIGVRLDIKENGIAIVATDYTITATSSSTNVVTVANISITKYNGYAIAQIVPTGVGYSDIKLALTKGSSTATATIKYAASAPATTPFITRFHSGSSDASAAISLDSNYMLIGDDEINSLFVYDRKNSGLPVKTYDYQNLLGLTDGITGNYLEIDLEAGVKSINYPNRIYWISSLGTSGSSNIIKPNINRLFATDITGTGSNTTFATIGYDDNIRSQLVTWGDTKGYNFTASAASGHDAKAIDGFNIEGMCFGPDNTSLFIAFRTPLVTITARTKALIAPILNFETWFNNGSPVGNPTFGSPIELDLGGRGFRDIIRLSNGGYIIITGNYKANPLNGAVYKWTGFASDVPVLIPNFNINNLNAETVVEVVENGVMAKNKLQIISDNGSSEYYNDGIQAKDLNQNNFKKFRSDMFSTTNNVLPVSIEYFKTNKIGATNYLQWKINGIDIEKIELEKAENNNPFYTLNSYFNNNKETQCNLAKIIPSFECYRLKLFHKNGSIEYSQIIRFKATTSKLNLTVYPNPATNFFWVNTNSEAVKTVIIYNTIGEIVYRERFSGYSIKIKNNFKSVGYYNIQVVSKDEEAVEKLFIVRP